MKNINLKFYKYSLNKKQKFKVLLGLFLNIFTIFIELFSISALIPLIIVILKGDINQIDLGFINNYKFYFEELLIIENLRVIILFTFILFLFKSFFFVLVTYFNAWLQGHIVTVVSNRIFEKYLSNSFVISNLKNTSELINDCTTVSEDFVKNYFMSSILAIKCFFTLVFIVLFLLILYPEIISIVFISLLIIYLIYYLLVKQILIKFGKKKLKLNELLIKIIKETSGALKELKLYNFENKFVNIHFNKKFQLERIKRLEKVITSLPKSFSELILILFVFIILLFYQNIEENAVGIALTISILGYSTLRIIPQIIFIVKYFNKLNFVKFVAKKVMILIQNDIEEDKKDNNNFEISLNKELKLENISYTYKDTGKEIFRDLDFKIKKGQIIGIMGESGVGKTTLVNIMLGLLNNYVGKITIDGEKIEFIKSNWQNKISLVPQDVMLFDDTILENITFNLNSNKNEKFFQNILDISQTKYFIENLPEKLNTIIGEDGKKLSAGQRQRLGIARALYRNPDLIIFDEATSSLDDENESKIVSSINNLKGEKTIIIVSHKPKPLEICDIIYKIENKKLVEIQKT